MRLVVVSIIAIAVVTAAFGSGPRVARAGSVDLKPRCGAHGWVLGAFDTSHTYQGAEVDQPAVPDRSNPAIPWPSATERSASGTVETDARYGATAAVVARFVVDTVGCIDSSTFKVVQASDTSFTLAVRRALPRLRYEPGRSGGHKVRSWVLWKFVFEHRNGSEMPN